MSETTLEDRVKAAIAQLIEDGLSPVINEMFMDESLEEHAGFCADDIWDQVVKPLIENP